MILNLTALMLQTFIVIIDFREDFLQGIKRHTIYPVMSVLGMKIPKNENEDDQYVEIGSASIIGGDECSLSIVSNISLIYSILIGMTDFWHRSCEKQQKQQENYY